MSERVIIGGAELWHGDCREVMSDWADGCVDHVITDVPYSAHTHKMAKTSCGAGTVHSLIDFAAVTDEEFLELFRVFVRVARRWVVSTCDLLQAPLLFGWEQFVRQGVWTKPNPMPQISGDRPGQGHEVVMCLHRVGQKRWNGGGRSAVWSLPVVQGGEYPTQKPLRLIDQFVADFTDPGDRIADPCMGSGTTGVSAVRLGRRFVGCEVRRSAFDLACERIAAAQAQSDLFVSGGDR